VDPKKILIETEQWLAVHKYAGELVVTDRWGKEPRSNILLHVVGDYLRAQGHQLDATGRDLYPVHRLDRDTSGVVLFAKNSEAHRQLSQLFESRQMHKIYWAYTQGNPEWDQCMCRVPLIRAEGKEGRGRAHIDLARGKPSETAFLVKGRYTDISWIEARPLTGRLHQIRVHLRMLGHPILQDSLYGVENWKSTAHPELQITRMPLHARELAFTDPIENKEVVITCPLDTSFRNFVTYFQELRKR
jgi:RluA family pseudouridine synthase